MFQSLFFWNHCLDFRFSQLIWLDCVVSILVFLEPLLRQSELKLKGNKIIEFQSLFFWNHCLDEEKLY